MSDDFESLVNALMRALEAMRQMNNRITALERGRLAAPFGQIPKHALERDDTAERLVWNLGLASNGWRDPIDADELLSLVRRIAPETRANEKWRVSDDGHGYTTAPAPDAPKPATCECRSCLDEAEKRSPPVNSLSHWSTRMVVCSTCGNKRCPHATDHRNACTNSNDPGQLGSSYAAPKPASEAQGEPTMEECLWECAQGEIQANLAGETGAGVARAGIAAVRTLCLASRAPSPSPALAALVEKADAMRGLVSACEGSECGAPQCIVVRDYDRARAALPKGGGA